MDELAEIEELVAADDEDDAEEPLATTCLVSHRWRRSAEAAYWI